MRISPQQFTELDLEVHQILRDVPLNDVSVLNDEGNVVRIWAGEEGRRRSSRTPAGLKRVPGRSMTCAAHPLKIARGAAGVSAFLAPGGGPRMSGSKWQELMKVHNGRQIASAHNKEITDENHQYRAPNKVVVAVLDDGCDVEHPSLQGVIQGSRSFEERKPVKNSGSSHGTLSAGLVAGEKRGTTFWGGVAYPAEGINVKLIAARYDPDLDVDNDVGALNTLVDDGARIVTNSHGWGLNEMSTNQSAKFRDEIRALAETKNAAILFSAGNEGVELLPRNIEFALYAIVVAATTLSKDQDERRSSASNYGAGITVCAPGFDHTSSDNLPMSTENNSRYGRHGNTSAAAPMVAGVLALMLLVNPDLTATQLKELLCLTADQIDKDNDHDKGKWRTAQAVLTQGQLAALPLSLRNRPYSKWYGFGRVNALKAVRAAVDSKQT